MSTDELAESATLPPYPEMILSAIEALDDKDGSSKSWISSYIESKYADHLPDTHPSLLEDCLQQMKDSGEVVMVNDNFYTKPDHSSAAPSKRPRGRPPKPRDPLAAALAKVVSGFRSGKPRGRPPKKPRTDSQEAAPAAAAAETAEAAAATPPSGVKRGRGRPPKVKAQFVDMAAAAAAATPPSGVKRGRGRPPKVKPQFVDVGFA